MSSTALFARFNVEPDRQEGFLNLGIVAAFSKIINQQVQFYDPISTF